MHFKLISAREAFAIKTNIRERGSSFFRVKLKVFGRIKNLVHLLGLHNDKYNKEGRLVYYYYDEDKGGYSAFSETDGLNSHLTRKIRVCQEGDVSDLYLHNENISLTSGFKKIADRSRMGIDVYRWFCNDPKYCDINLFHATSVVTSVADNLNPRSLYMKDDEICITSHTGAPIVYGKLKCKETMTYSIKLLEKDLSVTSLETSDLSGTFNVIVKCDNSMLATKCVFTYLTVAQKGTLKYYEEMDLYFVPYFTFNRRERNFVSRNLEYLLMRNSNNDFNVGIAFCNKRNITVEMIQAKLYGCFSHIKQIRITDRIAVFTYKSHDRTPFKNSVENTSCFFINQTSRGLILSKMGSLSEATSYYKSIGRESVAIDEIKGPSKDLLHLAEELTSS